MALVHGSPSAFFFFSFWDPMEWCHLHSKQLFPPQLNFTENSLMDTPRDGFAWWFQIPSSSHSKPIAIAIMCQIYHCPFNENRHWPKGEINCHNGKGNINTLISGDNIFS